MTADISPIPDPVRKNRSSNERSNLFPVGLALLVMALSLAAIGIIYTQFGHLSGYASRTMEQQQIRLRRQYGLPPEHLVTDPKILQIPPSLRNIPPSIYYNNPE
jgi:hypothetical protein